jgi:CubicO group peptidase (beta-lactamase class C family)
MNFLKSNFSQRLILLLLLATFQLAAFGQDKKNQINSLMSEAHKLGLFNGNVLVMQSGKQVYMGSLGPIETNSKVNLTRDYRFNIGSIAKEFNAVAIMMLKEENKLGLDDAISKHIPDLPAWADKVKVRHLLQYTSGIPNSNWKETKGDQDNLNNLKKVTALNFEPGTKYTYNNNDVFLQRQIVAHVSGMSFNDFVLKRMLKPLGIKNAIIDPTPADRKIAKAYNSQGVQDDMMPPISGWTNLNVDDFYIWSEALNNFKLISAASTGELLVPFSPGNQTGLGKGRMKEKKLVSHIHDGTSRNYQALLISEQDKGLTIILQTNNQQNNLYPISSSILLIMENKPYPRIRQSFVKVFSTEIHQMNGKQILSLYEQTKAKDSDRFAFNSEELLNEVGYDLLGQSKYNDAVEIFAFNTTLFPLSANASDSLGEAYLRSGDKARALVNYKKALKLDANLESAKKMVAELEK